ncbi:MAG: NAD(P)H-hydrate dehydratase [Lachnospiraceae bacterium]|nr:NAD(P)H-hydrate dehydratase [Lachnospiraceae bacterium]
MRYYLSGKQAQAIDRYTQDVIGIPGIVLMERAALKLAGCIDDACGRSNGFDRKKDKILAIAESGNNGGDAVAAARLLRNMGYDTYVYEVNGIGKKSDSYIKQIRIAENNSVKFIGQGNLSDSELYDLFSEYRVVIDGIFGVGLSREVTGVHKKVIDVLNHVSSDKDMLIVGCDIPSGICSDTGRILGCAVKCDMTVTFQYIKYGMLVDEGREYSGKIYCEDIGLYRPASVSFLGEVLSDTDTQYLYYEYEDEEISEHLPERKADSNKGSFGKVLILAGSKDIYGALYMCAESCLRCGAGLVRIVSDRVNRDLCMDKLPEAMMLAYDSDEPDKDFENEYIKAVGWADVILAGPGLGTGEWSKHLLEVLFDNCISGQSLVLDADALNIVSAVDTKGIFKKLTDKLGYEHIVITPHMGEMLRLLKGTLSMDRLRKNRAEAASYFAGENGVICILKDARTVIGCTGSVEGKKLIYVNTTGNSGMAKGGSGDVLSGIVAGIIAQNNNDEKTDYEMSCAAVHIHGRAGDGARDKKGETKMLARDIIDNIPVINGLT